MVKDKVFVGKVDVDLYPNLYKEGPVPHLRLFKKGKEIANYAGGKRKEDFLDFILTEGSKIYSSQPIQTSTRARLRWKQAFIKIRQERIKQILGIQRVFTTILLKLRALG